jgi:hypothetical protein
VRSILYSERGLQGQREKGLLYAGSQERREIVCEIRISAQVMSAESALSIRERNRSVRADQSTLRLGRHHLITTTRLSEIEFLLTFFLNLKKSGDEVRTVIASILGMDV